LKQDSFDSIPNEILKKIVWYLFAPRSPFVPEIVKRLNPEKDCNTPKTVLHFSSTCRCFYQFVTESQYWEKMLKDYFEWWPKTRRWFELSSEKIPKSFILSSIYFKIRNISPTQDETWDDDNPRLPRCHECARSISSMTKVATIESTNPFQLTHVMELPLCCEHKIFGKEMAEIFENQLRGRFTIQTNSKILKHLEEATTKLTKIEIHGLRTCPFCGKSFPHWDSAISHIISMGDNEKSGRGSMMIHPLLNRDAKSWRHSNRWTTTNIKFSDVYKAWVGESLWNSWPFRHTVFYEADARDIQRQERMEKSYIEREGREEQRRQQEQRKKEEEEKYREEWRKKEEERERERCREEQMKKQEEKYREEQKKEQTEQQKQIQINVARRKLKIWLENPSQHGIQDENTFRDECFRRITELFDLVGDDSAFVAKLQVIHSFDKIPTTRKEVQHTYQLCRAQYHSDRLRNYPPHQQLWGAEMFKCLEVQFKKYLEFVKEESTITID